MSETIPTPTPTTPIIVAPVVPTQPDGWDRFGRAIASSGRWITSFTEVTIGGGCRKAGGGVFDLAGMLWRNSPNIAGTAIIGLLLWFAAVQTGWTLPSWPWPVTPAQPTALEAAIHAAYLAETDPAKAAHAATLASTLSSFTPAARASGNVKTVGDLLPAMKTAIAAKGLTGALPVIDKAIVAELDASMPKTPATPMTDQLWLQTGSEFSRLADALKKGAK